VEQIKALLIRTDGTVEIVDIVPDLAQLQKAVDGYIEAIAGPGWVGYCDEEGLLKRKPANTVATTLARLAGWHAPGGQLVGDVVFVGPEGPDERHTDVPESLVKLVGLA
jgi:hypothetical protein